METICKPCKKPSRICQNENCNKYSSYNFENESKSVFCASHALDGMKLLFIKKCLKCDKQPCYNFKNELKGIYCKEHSLDGMQDIKNKKCIHPDCKIRAAYNFENEKKFLYCVTHALDGMQDIKTKKCLKCDKQPSYNFENEKKPLYCMTHALDGMQDIKNKRCLKCDKQPSYNFEGEKKSIYCKEHALDGMHYLRNNKCHEDGCKLQPCYNFKDEPYAIFCVTHAKKNMINIVSIRCLKCDKIPCYNFKDELKGIYCQEHALNGMRDIKSRRCLNCDKQPCYNIEGMKYGIYCVSHALSGMKNVTNRKCLSTFCNISVTHKVYEGYCLFCFIHIFPDKPVARNYKTKEKTVGDYIKENFSDLTWTLDKKVIDGCSKRRPDLLLDLGFQVIIIEIDENEHNRYEEICENKRTMEISQDIGFRPIIFIRFNPDDYIINDKKITSCWGQNGNGIMCIKNSKKKEWNERLQKLKETVTYWLTNVSEKTIEIDYLYFSLNNLKN